MQNYLTDILEEELKKTPNLMDYIHDLTSSQLEYDEFVDDIYGSKKFPYSEAIDEFVAPYIGAVLLTNNLDSKELKKIDYNFSKNPDFRKIIRDGYVTKLAEQYKGQKSKDEISKAVDIFMKELEDTSTVRDRFKIKAKDVTAQDLAQLIAKLKIKTSKIESIINNEKSARVLNRVLGKNDKEFYKNVLDNLPDARKEVAKKETSNMLQAVKPAELFKKIKEIDSQNNNKLFDGVKNTFIENTKILEEALKEIDDEFDIAEYFNQGELPQKQQPQQKEPIQQKKPSQPKSYNVIPGTKQQSQLIGGKENAPANSIFASQNIVKFMQKYSKELFDIQEHANTSFFSLEDLISYCKTIGKQDPIYESTNMIIQEASLLKTAVKGVKTIINGDKIGQASLAHRQTVLFFILWSFLHVAIKMSKTTKETVNPTNDEEDKNKEKEKFDIQNKKDANELINKALGIIKTLTQEKPKQINQPQSKVLNAQGKIYKPESYIRDDEKLINMMFEEVKPIEENILTHPFKSIKGAIQTGIDSATELVNFKQVAQKYDQFLENIFNGKEGNMLSKLQKYGFEINPKNLGKIIYGEDSLNYSDLDMVLADLSGQLQNKDKVKTIIRTIFQKNGLKKDWAKKAGEATGKFLRNVGNKFTKNYVPTNTGTQK